MVHHTHSYTHTCTYVFLQKILLLSQEEYEAQMKSTTERELMRLRSYVNQQHEVSGRKEIRMHVLCRFHHPILIECCSHIFCSSS